MENQTEEIAHEVVPADNQAEARSGTLEVVDSRIQTEIRKFNLADSKIAEMKAKCEALTIRPLPAEDDAAGMKAWRAELKAAKAGRTVASKTRTGLEAKRKEIKAEYLRTGEAIDEEAKRLKALVEPIEEMMDERIEKAEAEEKERKAEAERLEAEQHRARVDALIEAGIAFTGFYYEIGEISVVADTIKALPDAQFEDLRAKVIKAKADQVAAEAERQRIAEEEAAAAAEREAEVKRQAEALEADRKKLEEEKAALQKEKDDHAAEVERQRVEAEEAKNRAAAKEREDVIQARRVALEGLGMVWDSVRQGYAFINPSGRYDIHLHFVTEALPEAWAEGIPQFEAAIADLKKKEADRLEEEASAAKAEAERKERLSARLIELSQAGFLISYDNQLATFGRPWMKADEELNLPFAMIGGMDPDQWPVMLANWKETAGWIVTTNDEREAADAADRAEAARAKAEEDERIRKENQTDDQRARDYFEALLAVAVPEFIRPDNYGIVIDIRKMASDVLKGLPEPTE